MGDWLVSVPVIGVARIPVVADVSVMRGPVSSQADKDISAVMIWVHIPEGEVRPPIVINGIVISGPYYSVPYPVVPVSVYVLVAMTVFYHVVTFFESYFRGLSVPSVASAAGAFGVGT